MADYKSILKGTLNSVTKKAKDYVESGSLKEAYDKGSTTARCYANIAKLSLQINGELEEENKVFIEIGRLCYDENRDNPDFVEDIARERLGLVSPNDRVFYITD